jgi:hypothetical protein
VQSTEGAINSVSTAVKIRRGCRKALELEEMPVSHEGEEDDRGLGTILPVQPLEFFKTAFLLFKTHIINNHSFVLAFQFTRSFTHRYHLLIGPAQGTS